MRTIPRKSSPAVQQKVPYHPFRLITRCSIPLSIAITIALVLAAGLLTITAGCAFDGVDMERYAERVQTETLFGMAESATNMIADMALYQDGADIQQIESDRRLALEVLGRFRTLLRKVD